MQAAWREKAARVTAMSWAEVRTRLRQEASKRRDRALYGLGIDGAVREHRLGSGVRRPAAAPQETEASPRASGRFFFDTSQVPDILALLRERFPRECKSTIERAERICRLRFDVLGFHDLDYGAEIDWHLDPVNGKRAPRRPWYKIQYLDFDEVGDHKIVWEINRHQHLVTLALAHLLTRETRYLATLLGQWSAWQRENPYPLGVNWASSLEVALRSLAWLWVAHLLAVSEVAPRSFQAEVTHGLARNAQHIERYLSTYSSPNTHLLGEAVALFAIGTLRPRLRSAARWQQTGWRIIVEESAHQVLDDGMHFEQSIYYHVYALDCFLHARILAARNGISIPEPLERTIERMLAALAAVSQAGIAPRFGDDDGGRVFDPRRNRAEHMLDPLSTGAALYRRADFRAASAGLTEETLWLLGPNAVREFDQLPARPAPAASAALAASGYYVLAASADAPAGRAERPERGAGNGDAPSVLTRRQLVIDAGPQGTGNSGHGHADALSVQVAIDGRECLIDPGTFRYVTSEARRDRDQYRGTSAHNTLVVDRLSQADPAGPFSWKLLPKVQAELWASSKRFDLFLGSHTGYKRLASPVVHRRTVFYLKPDFWLIRDAAEGYGCHDLELPWHFGRGFAAHYTAPGFTLMPEAGSGSGLSIVAAEGHGWSQEVSRFSLSAAYGVEQTASVIRFAASTNLPADFAVVLQPAGEIPERLGKLKRTTGRQAAGYCYQAASGRHVMICSDSAHSAWELGGVTSDARFVYLGAGGTALRLAFAGGTFLEIDGDVVIRCDRRVEWCEVAGAHIDCSDPGAAVNFNPAPLDIALEQMTRT
ncbi:MAG: alginate lyase family protein [Terriglobia bacterium]